MALRLPLGYTFLGDTLISDIDAGFELKKFHDSIHKRLRQFFTLNNFFHDFISLVIFEIISSAGLEIRPNPMHNSLKGNFSL